MAIERGEGEWERRSEGVDPEELTMLLRYESATFQERLRALVESDETYRHYLDAELAVLESNQLPQPEIKARPPKLPPYNEGQIELLARFIGNSQVDRVVIEAGHVYNYHDVHKPNLASALESQFAQAAAITDRLRSLGVEVRQMLFIDNYNPNPETGELDEMLDMGAYVDLANRTGYAPEFVAYEADMVRLSRKILEDLTRRRLVKERNDEARQVLLKYRSHELFRPDDGPEGMYSCALLDAALSMLKLTRLAEGSVTVLPRRTDGLGFSYNSQQRKTRQIVGEHLGTRVLPLMNFYTGDSIGELSSAGGHHTFRKKR